MLQLLRGKKSSLIVKIVLVLIVIGFSFFGIESYFVANPNAGVAKVGDVEISQDEFRERFNQERQQMMQMTNGALDAAFFERPEFRKQVLDRLVNEKLLLAANDRLGLVVPAQRVREEILKIPAFQVDGVFNKDQYQMVLQSNGMTPQMFQDRVQQDLARLELPTQVQGTVLVTEADVDNYLRLRDQKRDVRYVKLPRPEAKEIDVPDADIEAYYKEHEQDFMTPERIALQYLELDASQLAIDMTPDDAVLKDRYEKEKSRFVTAEQRQASHILVKVEGKGSPDDQRAALAKAEAIETQIREGKDFAALAKENSADLGSRNAGGDLGWIERGMTDQAFEDALYALEAVDDVSAPVLGADGYHIIRLTGVRPGTTRTFDEVRDQLVKEYTDTERERVYSEKAGRLTDLAYEDPSSLEPAAKELGLEIKKTPLFSRQGGAGIAGNPAVIRAAFADSVLVQNNNSDPIDLGGNHVVVVRIAEHQAAAAKPLAEVRDQVRQRVIAERNSREAKARADGLFAELGTGKSLAEIAEANGLTVETRPGLGRQAGNVDSALVTAVFAMPHPAEDAPSRRLVDLGRDEYAIVELDGVTDGATAGLDAKTREAAANTLRDAIASSTAVEFVDALRRHTDVSESLGKLADEQL